MLQGVYLPEPESKSGALNLFIFFQNGADVEGKDGEEERFSRSKSFIYVNK